MSKVDQKHKTHSLSSIMYTCEEIQNTLQRKTYSRKFLSLQKCEGKKKKKSTILVMLTRATRGQIDTDREWG